jgi:hypothetical protein
LQAPPLDLIRNPFEDIADVDDDEMRAEVGAWIALRAAQRMCWRLMGHPTPAF